MRFFVSALLLAAASAGFAQVQTLQLNPAPAAPISMDRADQPSCPLMLTSAAVAPPAGVLPVAARTRGDGVLALHFRNQSGKAIQSAAITARLRVKTNVYALDATPLEMRLAFSGGSDPDKAVDQLTHIPLPSHVYLFGVARVTLDQVTFADGSVWSARGSNSCAVGGPGSLRVEAK